MSWFILGFVKIRRSQTVKHTRSNKWPAFKWLLNLILISLLKKILFR
jgi:hypothetical protein